jgi:hypothetical protein
VHIEKHHSLYMKKLRFTLLLHVFLWYTAGTTFCQVSFASGKSKICLRGNPKKCLIKSNGFQACELPIGNHTQTGPEVEPQSDEIQSQKPFRLLPK